MTQVTKRQPYLDSLQTCPTDVQEALEILALREAERCDDTARQSTRYTFRMPSPMEIVLLQPGGSVGRFQVVPHNISNTGLGFLHGAFVHLGTVCQMKLVTLDDKIVVLRGKTKHATCVRGRVHFIGVEFDCSIDVLDFVRLTREPNDEVVHDREQALKVAKELGEMVMSNATISELRAKYTDLGRALFADAQEKNG